jgi:hypothetical protein
LKRSHAGILYPGQSTRLHLDRSAVFANGPEENKIAVAQSACAGKNPSKEVTGGVKSLLRQSAPALN